MEEIDRAEPRFSELLQRATSLLQQEADTWPDTILESGHVLVDEPKLVSIRAVSSESSLLGYAFRMRADALNVEGDCILNEHSEWQGQECIEGSIEVELWTMPSLERFDENFADFLD